MKRFTAVFVAVTALTLSLAAQSKSNDAISRQIRLLAAERSITLTHEPGSSSSKLMAVAENFNSVETDRAGIRAMNFAAGFFYSGTELNKAPDPILFTFWVMAKRPRFSSEHRLIVFAGNETLDIGEARYAARARDNMEYLNFNVPRAALEEIAANSNVRFTLGGNEFSFTKEQLRLIANLLVLSDPAN